MPPKSHQKESETTFWGWPKYYTSYERRPPRCHACDRRYGIFGVLDSFLPYIRCSCGDNGNSWWSPNYGWDGEITGLKRRKGCRKSDHWSYKYASWVDKDQLPDYVAGRHAREPECADPKIYNDADYTSSRSSRQRRSFVEPYVADPSISRSTSNRSAWEREKTPENNRVVVVDDDHLTHYERGGGKQYGHDGSTSVYGPTAYARQEWEPSAPATRALWKNALKRRGRGLRGGYGDMFDDDRERLIVVPAQGNAEKARRAFRDTGSGGLDGKRRATAKVPSPKQNRVTKHVHFR